VSTLMQFKKGHTHRQTDTQTHRAYKWLQVPPSKLTPNVGNDNTNIWNLVKTDLEFHLKIAF